MDRKLKQTSLLSYWTMRYFLILCVGLLALAAISVWWTNRERLDSRLQTVQLLVQEIADRFEVPNGIIVVPRDLPELIDKRTRFLKLGPVCIIVTDKDGKLLYSTEPLTQADLPKRLNDKLDKAIQPGFKAVTAPIENNGNKIGQVSLLQPTKPLTNLTEAKGALGLLLVSLTLLGWLTIYLLSRKLARPIRKVVSAAREISLGHYDIQLEVNAKEREINELVVSFKEMAGRLKQLEHSRNFMLAGLTHELKTPVTSVKGLVHAVKEKVVKNEEADEFLEIALQETGRLERMVADLLDYNQLAAGLVQVSRHRIDAAALLSEISYQWTLHQGEDISDPELSLPPGRIVEVEGDPLRIQQIMVNLFNNSVQSKHSDRPIHIRIALRERNDGFAEIVVFDNGYGIPLSERNFVFERFFRGESKKQTVRGLGLGLAFSRLLAQAQGGELALRDSSKEGSSFSLTLPLASSPPD